MPVVPLERLERGAIPLWSFPGLDVPGLTVAVTGREGGVSTGAYGTFNLGTHVDDSPTAVALNALMLSGAFGGDSVTFVNQVHGNTIVESSMVTTDTEADAIVVRVGDRATGIRVADCVPIAIIDPRQRVCVVVHAGWRGLASGVIERAVRTLTSEPGDVIAAVGPSISHAAYQVGPEVIAQHDDFGRNSTIDGGDRYKLDLRAVTATQLSRAGVRDDQQLFSLEVTDGGTQFFSDRAERPCGRFALIAKWES